MHDNYVHDLVGHGYNTRPHHLPFIYPSCALQRQYLGYEQRADCDIFTRNDQECSTLSTVYYAVPVVTTVTETVDLSGSYAVVGSDSSQVGFSKPASFSAVVSGPPEPTSFSEITSFPHATAIPQGVWSPSVPSVSGVYFFTVSSGTTEWLGGQTPLPAQSYVIETSTVVIEPIPSSTFFLSRGESTSSSTTTIEAASISAAALTETLTGSPTSATGHVISPSFASIGSCGWNCTTLHRVKHTGTWSGKYGSSAYNLGTSSFATSFLTQHNSSSTPTPLGHQYRNKYARQVGVMVTATIDGVVVSWTNTYDGLVASTPPPSSIAPSLSSFEVQISGMLQSVVTKLGPNLT